MFPDAFTDLHGLVENAAADLDHLQVLLLLVPRTLDVGHPAPLVLLTGVDEIPDASVLVKHLKTSSFRFLRRGHADRSVLT